MYDFIETNTARKGKEGGGGGGGMRVTLARARIFFPPPLADVLQRRRWKISSIYVSVAPNILNIDIYYIEASVTRDRIVIVMMIVTLR